jgi:hypothetical protein
VIIYALAALGVLDVAAVTVAAVVYVALKIKQYRRAPERWR